MTQPIVRVQNLKTHFTTVNGTVRAVDDVSFTVHRGEILAIVGESGSGKTVAVRNLLGLNDSKNATVEGSIRYSGSAGETRTLMGLNHEQWRAIRGREIGMIFQEPMSSFDPLTRLGQQAVEAYRAHFAGTASQARDCIINLLRKVHIPDAEQRFEQYPHQMSGGMLQRFMIAIVLSCRPALLIADEPTTALDVTIQAQILQLIRQIRADFGTSIIFISHDLGVVSQIADRVLEITPEEIIDHHVSYDDFLKRRTAAFERSLRAEADEAFAAERRAAGKGTADETERRDDDEEPAASELIGFTG